MAFWLGSYPIVSCLFIRSSHFGTVRGKNIGELVSALVSRSAVLGTIHSAISASSFALLFVVTFSWPSGLVPIPVLPLVSRSYFLFDFILLGVIDI